MTAITQRPGDRLARMRLLARALLLFERLWPALWPVFGLLGGFVCAALLGVPQLLPPGWHLVLLLGVLAAIAVLAWHGLRPLTIPDAAAADRRLERDSGLRHRPLATLADYPAPGTGDPALWQAHLARLAGTVAALRLVLPRPGLARQDPRAWRGLLLLGLAVAIGVAGADAPTRLRGALLPHFPSAVPPPVPRLTAWITPPGYTGMAPVLLDATRPDVSVPVGARLTASLSAGRGAVPVLAVGDQTTPFQVLAEDERGASWQVARTLQTGGTLAVRRGGQEIARWQLTAIADVPPSVQWPADPSATASRIPMLRLPWQVAHPYGVASLQAELRLQQRPAAPPLIVPIPLPDGAPRAARGARLADLTASPWAGLPVLATLSGHDTAGLAGRSAERSLTLPERHFLNPAARAVVAVRRLLALQPEERGAPLAALAALAGNDALWQADSGGYLNLRGVMQLLARAPTQGDTALAAIDIAQDRLWQLALHLEEGAPARAEKALAQARRALHEALDATRQKPAGDKAIAPKDAAARAELARREQALQQALQQYMQALRRQAQTDPRHPAPPEQQAMEAQRALRRMQQATQSGTMEDAQQQMAEVDQALDALEQARRDAETTPRQRQRQAGRQRGQQQMGVLSDIVRHEAAVLDHAQSRAEPADPGRFSLDFPPDLQPAPPAGAGSGQGSPADAAQRHADARIQDALRRALGVLMQQYGDLTGNVPHNLGDADQGMHDALAALGGAQDGQAAAAAQRAIAALQQGGQAMQQQLAQQFGRGPSESGQGQDSGSDPQGPGEGEDGQGGKDAARPRSDPFGRALQEGAAGSTDGGETAVPETVEQARTRAIQDELRRRGADRTRPPRELDYIGRLLNTP